MRVQQSESLMLIWKIAALQAKLLKSDKIEPIHLFLALLKSVDVDLTEIVKGKPADRDVILEQLLHENTRLRNVFRCVNLDAKLARRRIRNLNDAPRVELASTKVIHRADEAKKLFAEAAKLAALSEKIVQPIHLLMATLMVADEHRDKQLHDLGVDLGKFQRAVNSEIFNTPITRHRGKDSGKSMRN